jgi:lipoic acid synthetase
MPKKPRTPRPEWLKVRLTTGENFKFVSDLIAKNSLNTVCQEARCPNIFECFSKKTATFMILGDICTRHCGFCSVAKGTPPPPDPDEPAKVAEAAADLGLDYVVVTSVDRDDLPDEGSQHFAGTIEAIRRRLPRCRIEVLIPDFNGRSDLLENVLLAGPDVLAHNVETVSHLYPRVRPVAAFEQSLRILEEAVRFRSERGIDMKVKSGIMVGLGETMPQVLSTMEAIARTGCDIMTVGQYLSPKKRALPVERFYTPEEFELIRKEGEAMGFSHVESGPLVRSSYHAKEQLEST